MAARAHKLDKSVHSEGQSAFSKLMIEARKSARLTQHEVAKRLHKPQSFIAKYEGGERRIDVVEFVTVCQDRSGSRKTSESTDQGDRRGVRLSLVRLRFDQRRKRAGSILSGSSRAITATWDRVLCTLNLKCSGALLLQLPR
jgi:transcriptional regulator with XRE-family HTH domain